MSKIRENFPSYREHKIPAIYLITNLDNGKIYVGQTVNFYTRFHKHKNSVRDSSIDGRAIVSAFRKYGFERFEFSILESPDVCRLTEREQFWIDRLRACERSVGYNLAPAASSCLGVKHSMKTRQKVAQAGAGRKHSEETKRLMSRAQKGKKLTESHRKRISQVQLGRRNENKAGRSVEQICLTSGIAIAVFRSASAAHKQIGGGVANILHVCKGLRKSAGGYAWRFACLA